MRVTKSGKQDGRNSDSFTFAVYVSKSVYNQNGEEAQRARDSSISNQLALIKRWTSSLSTKSIEVNLTGWASLWTLWNPNSDLEKSTKFQRFSFRTQQIRMTGSTYGAPCRSHFKKKRRFRKNLIRMLKINTIRYLYPIILKYSNIFRVVPQGRV